MRTGLDSVGHNKQLVIYFSINNITMKACGMTVNEKNEWNIRILKSNLKIKLVT